MDPWRDLKSVLCVRLDTMSGVLLTIPALRALKESMPGCRLAMLTSTSGAQAARLGGLAESAGAEGLVIGAHGGDHAMYSDCREEFMRAFAEAMKLGTYAGIRLLRPFISMDKAAVAREGSRLGVDFARTWPLQGRRNPLWPVRFAGIDGRYIGNGQFRIRNDDGRSGRQGSAKSKVVVI